MSGKSANCGGVKVNASGIRRHVINDQWQRTAISHNNQQRHKTKRNETEQSSSACSLRTQMLYSYIFGWTPARSSAIRAKRKKFIGWAKRAIAIGIGAHFVAYLLALKDGATMNAAQ